VIRDFSMELNRGESVALLGRTDPVKHTTFYAVGCLVMPKVAPVTIEARTSPPASIAAHSG